MNVGTLANLVEEKQVAAVGQAIVVAVAQSYKDDRLRGRHGAVIVQTAAETKRRAQICIDTFKMLRGDLKWSTQRAIDMLAHALRCKLEGIEWQPEKRASWLGSEFTRGV